MNCFADIAIIGGGASGLVSAISAKRLMPDAEVIIVEGLSRVGKKLITTGNGRCNISNTELTLSHFHSENSGFAKYALSKYGNEATQSFFESIGVPIIAQGNKLYPASLQASSVVDCLRFECERLGIKILTDFKVDTINPKNKIVLACKNNIVTARAAIFCAGLHSGGEAVGCDGSILKQLKNLGLKTVKLSPSIVQLKTETDYVKQLKGIKVDAGVTLCKNERPIAKSFGEVLFCEYGLSGPAIMNISRPVARDNQKFFISLDLFPNETVAALGKRIISRRDILGERDLEEFLTGMINKRLGQVILKSCHYPLSYKANDLSNSDCNHIAQALKDFRFKVVGTTGFVNSQVTAGGISTDEFDSHTLMCKKYRGLFAAGELLDIDGDCGGYNLAWAWASGMLAAEGAVKYLGESK